MRLSDVVVYFRLIFWTEWLRSHRQTARIGRALGDGSNVTYIRTSQLGWPNGLAVDIRFRRIWWCDAMFDRYFCHAVPLVCHLLRDILCL